MQIKTFSFLTVLLFCLFMLHGVTIKATIRPYIVFEKVEYDLGTLRKSEKDVFVFKIPFSNTGKRKLKIKKLESSCECMTVKTDRVLYEKGQNGYILVSLDLRTLPRKEIYREIIITTNSKNGKNTISINATIEE